VPATTPSQFQLTPRAHRTLHGKPLRLGAARAALDPIEIASRDEIAALQLARLQWSVRHAYDNVAHTRAKFAAAGVHPDDIRRLEDIAKLPFTTKDDLRQTYPMSMFAVPQEKVARIHASSGTTGRPTVVGYTKTDLLNWAALGARSIRAAGARPGDIVHVAYGYGLFTGGLGAHYAAETLGCTVIPMSGGQTEKQVQLIADLKPQIIMVTPSYMLVIGDEFERQGLDPRSSSLLVGIHGAEPWTEGMRQEIEARFAIDAIDIFGLSEVMGPGVANECIETKDGPTLWEDHFYPEIIDPDSGAVLPEGSTGELVLTTLTKEALPVIRYRTRDLTALLPGTARAMRRMARITGRSDDMLIIRGVNLFPTQIEALILRDERLAPHYLLEVRREGRLDDLDVLIELKPGGGEGEDCARVLAQSIKSLIGLTARIRIEPPGTIARSLGKAKRVNDLRGKE